MFGTPVTAVLKIGAWRKSDTTAASRTTIILVRATLGVAVPNGIWIILPKMARSNRFLILPIISSGSDCGEKVGELSYDLFRKTNNIGVNRADR